MPLIQYIADSENNFKTLETAFSEFKKNYEVVSDGTIFVKRGSNDAIDIYPNNSSRIDEVSPIVDHPEGKLFRSKPERVIFKIGTTQYVVDYKPKIKI